MKMTFQVLLAADLTANTAVSFKNTTLVSTKNFLVTSRLKIK